MENVKTKNKTTLLTSVRKKCRNFSKVLTTLLLAVILLNACGDKINGELLFLEPEPGDGFNYPYFLFLPDNFSQGERVYVIIEPNNSGFVADDLKQHKEKAKRTAAYDYYLGNYVAQQLQYPLLVPVFPRTESDWKTYTHALDRDVMLQKNNQLERLDLQLIAMFKHAQTILNEKEIHTYGQFLLTGFSASGTFANRFTLLHPELVYATAAGGLNGLLMLPLDSLNHEALNYPIGVNDLPEIIDEEFNKKHFSLVPQFYFMGELDDNDAVPYDDAYSSAEREQIFRLVGKQMQPIRWNKCRELYLTENTNATIKTYKEVGHKHPEHVKKEIVDFFKKVMQNQRQ